MGIVTLVPNGSTTTSGTFTITGGAASAAAALTDGQPSTGLKTVNNVGNNQIVIALSSFTLIANRQVRSVTATVYTTVSSGSQGITAYVAGGPSGNGPSAYFPGISPYSSGTPVSGIITTPAITNSNGWTQSNIDGLSIVVSAPDTYGASTITEAYVTVVYDDAPTTTISSPSAGSSITTTPQPNIVLAYNDPEGAAKERHIVRLFTAAQYATGGFNADNTTAFPPVWDSGNVVSSSLTVPVTSPLPNGAYRILAKTSDQGSNGRFGAWGNTNFTISVNPPSPPSINTIDDPSNSRVLVKLQGTLNLFDNDTASLEGSGVGSWSAYSNLQPVGKSAITSEGAYSLLMTPSAAGTIAATTGQGVNGVPVTPGKVYSAQAESRLLNAGPARSAFAEIWWFTSAGAAASTPTSIGNSSLITTGWSNLIATATAPANAAYAALHIRVTGVGGTSEQVLVDKAAIHPGASSSWSPAGFLANQDFYVERSDDSGVTYKTIRLQALYNGVWTRVENLPLDVNQYVEAYDYEAPRGALSIYRARSYSSNGSFASFSDYTVSGITPALLTDNDWYFKVPYNPSLNYGFGMLGPNWSISTPEVASFFSPIGRNRKVKVYDVIMGDEFDLTVLCETNADKQAFLAIRNQQGTVLLTAPDGRQWWGSFDTNVTQNEIFLGVTTDIAIHFVETDAVS